MNNEFTTTPSSNNDIDNSTICNLWPYNAISIWKLLQMTEREYNPMNVLVPVSVFVPVPVSVPEIPHSSPK